MLSALTHPSYGGGLFTVVPLKAKYTGENWLGVWGDKAEHSVGTIFILLQYLFPVLVLGRNLPFDISQPHFNSRRTYDEGNEMHRHVHIGRDILASLILQLGYDVDAPHFFPEIDESIWREDDTVDTE